MMWVALGVSVLVGAVAGVGYWRINPKQGQVAPEVATSLKTPPNSALPVPAMVPPRPPPPLVVGLRQLEDKRPPDEPTTLPVAAPPVAASAAEAPASFAVATVPQALAAAKPAAAPRDDVFVVRFDSKLPGLTPSGLRALDAALRAADQGRKVRIQIDGCEDHDSMPTGIDCEVLTRRLKWILADRGVDHPAHLIASQYPPPISVPATPPVSQLAIGLSALSGQTTTSSVVAQSPAPAPAAEAPPPDNPLPSPAPPAKPHRRAANRQPSPVAKLVPPIGFEF
jgi:hypothetical protein